MKPSLETLREVIRACGLELGFRLTPYDVSQDEVISAALGLSLEERLEQLEGWAEFILEAREHLTTA